MSESNPNCKRDADEFEEASSGSVSPLKKKKLDDSSPDSHGVVLAVPSPSVASPADSGPGGYSVTSAAEDDDKSFIISSGCFCSESNEIAKNNPTSVVDLEDHQISETETSTSITSNLKERNPVSGALGETTETESSSETDKENQKKPPEVSKRPTAEEIEEFFWELEGDGYKQKQFIEKYNFDIVNDKPLEGRYKWDRLNP